MPTTRKITATPSAEAESGDALAMVDFDLDAVERPGKDVVRPFVVNIGGRPVSFSDPAELDWLELANTNDPVSLLLDCAGEDRAYILDQRIEGWRIGRLAEAFLLHFKMEEKYREAQRRASALTR